MRIILFLFVFLFIVTEMLFAATPAKKLSRGVANVITSPVEIIKETRSYWIDGSQKTDHILVWIFSGFVKGNVEMVKRAASGLWDVVSFPVAVPREYESLVKPACVFENWPQRPKGNMNE